MSTFEFSAAKRAIRACNESEFSSVLIIVFSLFAPDFRNLAVGDSNKFSKAVSNFGVFFVISPDFQSSRNSRYVGYVVPKSGISPHLKIVQFSTFIKALSR